MACWPFWIAGLGAALVAGRAVDWYARDMDQRPVDYLVGALIFLPTCGLVAALVGVVLDVIRVVLFGGDAGFCWS